MFIIKRNDLKPVLTATLTEDGAAVDLTGATSVKFMMRLESNPGATLKVNAAAAFASPRTSGGVSYAWVGADTDTAGDYVAEWEVTWSTGEKQTYPGDTYMFVRVLEDLG